MVSALERGIADEDGAVFAPVFGRRFPVFCHGCKMAQVYCGLLDSRFWRLERNVGWVLGVMDGRVRKGAAAADSS